MSAMDFGLTNDKDRYDAAVAWRDAAIADGWTAEPTYGDHEPMESHATLSKAGGWKAHAMCRVAEGRFKYHAEISVWGPDGLAIRAAKEYSMAQLIAGLRHCNYCDKDDVATERVSFAGRCCAACLPEQRKISERPGWTD